MLHSRRTALIAGALYLLTVVTSIPALALKEPALRDPASLGLPGGTTPLLLAVLLEVVLAAACVGTAVVLYPVLWRHSEAAALGFVAARVTEGMLIMTGALAMFSITVIPGPPASLDGNPLGVGQADAATGVLVAMHDAAFLLGPGLIPAANALLLGWLLYKSRLVPRILPIIGFIGAPLLVLSVVATLFGSIDQVSTVAGLAALPIAVWEISLGVWLIAKGFRTDALAQLASPGHPAAASGAGSTPANPPLVA